jgi:GTP cyclohydrolase I
LVDAAQQHAASPDQNDFSPPEKHMPRQNQIDQLKRRLVANGASYFANDNIADHLERGDLDAIEAEVAERMRSVLDALVIDVEADHNTQDTARRVAKMFVREVFAGRYEPRPKMTDFPNAKQLDEMYVVGPIAVRSACSHHLTPIMGEAFVGVIPGSRVIGLSKFNRLAYWIMARPQIQEEAVVQLADELEGIIAPKALGVVVRARHFCGCWRGVKDDTLMTTSVMRGLFRDSPHARAEFMEWVKGSSK